MSDYKKQLDDLQKKIQERKVSQAKYEERKTTLETEKSKLDEQMKEAGITNVEELKTEITSLETEIKESLEKCQSMME